MTDRERRQRLAEEVLRRAEQAAREPKRRPGAVEDRADQVGGDTADGGSRDQIGTSGGQREPDERDRRGRRGAGRRRKPAAAEPGGDHGPQAEPESVAREIVLRKLTAQGRSRSELATALAQQDVPEDAASAVLDRMEDVGLVDDKEFAETWVRNRQERRFLSKRALRQELIRKGVQRDDIDSALEGVEPEAELEAARALATKKLRSMSGLDRRVQYRRLAGVLGRRGFTPGQCAQVIDEVLAER